MKVILVGIRNVTFKDKETNNTVEGQTIYYEYEDYNVLGCVAERAFLPAAKRLLPVPSVPCSASIFYNKYGKVDEVVITS